ncbi:MAG: sigma-54 dependent transcriptional regulator [Desulfobacterales bacterium]|jgi:transcriptional regulator with GAF, ATPase, and Fis domain/tetratricopeptide (TPR) repeat protein|nr:sigma-54 dependent transcriptional regulator [Desulfobacterales bacterium]
MIPEDPQFSQAQWEFLATLQAFNTPLPIDILGTLAPLMPGPLFDLLLRSEHLGFMKKTNGDILQLTANLPPGVLKTLQSINSPERISEIFDQLRKDGLLSRLNPTDIVNLLIKAKRHEDAAAIQLDLAETAIHDVDMETAIMNLIQVVEAHLRKPKPLETEKRLIDRTLTVSDQCIAMGKGFAEVLPLLQKLLVVSDNLGDRRSHAIILLHLGRLYYLSNMNTEALKALSDGKQMVEELGDEDILFQSAEFVGLFYFMQGNYKQALIHYERASEWGRYTESDTINPFAPVFFSLTALALGQFNRAIDLLDIFHRIAIQKKQPNVSTTLRAVLGYMLLTFHKDKEALYHLSVANEEAKKQKNALALYGVRLFKSYYHYLKGNLTEARDLFVRALSEAAHANIIRAYAAYPWVLEMLFDFERQNVSLPHDFSFDTTAERVKQDINSSLKGVLMRLLAKRAIVNGESIETIQAYLEDSLKFLTHSGSVVQTAKTRLELARLELTKGNRKKAAGYARKAWQSLPAYAERLFPDDLQHLIDTGSKGPFLKSFLSAEVVFNRFSEVLEKLVPASDLKVILGRLVATTNRFFSAERGGFFLVKQNAPREQLELLTAVNLTELEITSNTFKPHIQLISDAFRTNRAILTRPSPPGKQNKRIDTVTALCLPIDLGNERRGILYHDNSLLMDSFDFLDDHALELLKTHLETLCRQIWEYCHSAQRKTRQASEKEIETENTLKEKIIGESRAIGDLLKKAQRIADSESPILIQGETGAGKEIMARWIHKHSPRHNGPYVIIDSTTIAENLLESELFGHEKGAFTGASRQKAGRVELANGGTLFLDEVGELPLSIQAKLLRVLEEKTFTRVGGSRVHRCDFRLIAATNRNLAKEVQAGRFREDLFYRLNVLPLQIPPLRERKEDIILMARHFLGIYCKRLNRPQFPISPKNVSALLAYPWPGNVRELKNVIERGALLSNGSHLELQLSATPVDPQSFSITDLPSMQELQRRYIGHVLKKTEGRIGGPGGAADILGMNRSTLYFRMKKLDMPLNSSPNETSPD